MLGSPMLLTTVSLQTRSNSAANSHVEKIHVHWIAAETLGKGWQVKTLAMQWMGKVMVSLTKKTQYLLPSSSACLQYGHVPCTEPCEWGENTAGTSSCCWQYLTLIRPSGKDRLNLEELLLLAVSWGQGTGRYRTEPAGDFQIHLLWKNWKYICLNPNSPFISILNRQKFGREASQSKY